MEKLRHARDYLTDEFVHDGCRFAQDGDRLSAIDLLASLNRQIYDSCAIEATVQGRVREFFRRLLRQAGLQN